MENFRYEFVDTERKYWQNSTFSRYRRRTYGALHDDQWNKLLTRSALA